MQKKKKNQRMPSARSACIPESGGSPEASHAWTRSRECFSCPDSGSSCVSAARTAPVCMCPLFLPFPSFPSPVHAPSRGVSSGRQAAATHRRINGVSTVEPAASRRPGFEERIGSDEPEKSRIGLGFYGGAAEDVRKREQNFNRIFF